MSAFPADHTVIVTGAASPRGIGRATVDRLAGQGWHIGIIDLDESHLGGEGFKREANNLP